MSQYHIFRISDLGVPYELDRTPRYYEAVSLLADAAEAVPQSFVFIQHAGQTIRWRRGPRVGGYAPEA